MSKKDEIAAAADSLFYREGFAATGIDRLAEAAGAALGTVYRHYDGRRAIVLAALAHREEDFFRHLEAAPPGLAGLFDALSDWAGSRGGNGCLFLRAAAAHPEDAALRDWVAEHKRRYLGLVTRGLVAEGWPEEAAAARAPAIFLLLEGAVAAALPLGSRAAIAEARAAAEMLAGAGPPQR